MRALLLARPETDAAMRHAIVSAGHDLLAPLPVARAGIVASERERFLTCVDRMMEADLLVADAEAPDALWCASWMLARGRLVVLACRKEARGSLSAMVAGNPSPWQKLVLHGEDHELREGLAAVLGS